MSKSIAALGSGIAALALAVGAGTTATAAPALQQAAPSSTTLSGSLPPSCTVTITGDTSASYVQGNKVSPWAPIALPPGGARYSSFTSKALDDRSHILAITSDGRAFDSSVREVKGGVNANVSALDPTYTAIGQTLPGIIDLDVASEELGQYDRRPARVAYAVTADGKLHSIPITYENGSPRLGTPTVLSAPRLSSLRGIEEMGRYWNSKRVTKTMLMGHTNDGRLVELSVDRTKTQPTLTYRLMASGWGKVQTLALGWCTDQAQKKNTIILTIDDKNNMKAHVDRFWSDGSLALAKVIQLGRWNGAPTSTLF